MSKLQQTVGREPTTGLAAIDQPASLTRLAHQQLRDSILRGELKSGEVYNEMTLAKDMGVSRTPVREALLELATHGLVTFLPRRGVRINYFSEHDVDEVFELRELIEVAAVEKAVRTSSPGDLEPMCEAMRAGRKAAANGDSEGFLAADRMFHHHLVELSGNRRMHAILENLRDIIHVMSGEAVSRAARMDEVIAEHECIFEHLKAGRIEDATTAIHKHLCESKAAVLAGHSSAAIRELD